MRWLVAAGLRLALWLGRRRAARRRALGDDTHYPPLR